MIPDYQILDPGLRHRVFAANTVTWADLRDFLLTPYPHRDGDEWGCATCWGVAKWNSFFYAQRVTE